MSCTSACRSDRRAQARAAARVLGDAVAGRLPWAPAYRRSPTIPPSSSSTTPGARRSRSPAPTGCRRLGSAGNVLLPEIACKLSLRLPPTCDATRAAQAVREALEREPPYGAQVTFECRLGDRRLECARRSRPGSRSRSPAPRARCTVARRCTSAAAAPFPSWACWVSAFRARSSSSPECSVRTPTRTARTSSCTSDYAKKLTACVSLVLADHARTLGGSAHVDHVARLDRLLQALPALAVSRGALGRRHRSRPCGNSARSASIISVHLGRPLGNLPRRVNTMRPSTGTSPATALTAAMRS